MVGGKIQKVKHPCPSAIIIEIFAHRARQNLLISIEPTAPRMHLIYRPVPPASEDVTPLLLLLRKHLVGAHIDDVWQQDLERVVFLSIGRSKSPRKFTLAVELMGRHSNLVLVDEQNLVMDALKRVPPSLSTVRPLLPRLPYTPPPPTGKRDWRNIAPAAVAALATSAEPTKPLWAWVLSNFAGLGHDTCRELVCRAYSNPDVPTVTAVEQPEPLVNAFQWLAGLVRQARWEPTLLRQGDAYIAAYPFRPNCPVEGSREPCDAMSRAVEALFADQAHDDTRASLRTRVVKAITDRRERALRRVQALREAHHRTSQADDLIRQGQLLLAFQGSVPPKARTVTIDGIDITLDPQRDVVRNAQAKFEEAKRLRRSAEIVRRRLEEASAEADFWEEQLAMAELAESRELLQKLRQEIERTAPSRKSDTRRQPLSVNLSDGSRVLIGRTALENQHVLSMASKGDLWLHAKDYHGSHVLVKPKSPPVAESVLREAAAYAAYFSRARGQSKVEVMVAEARHVRRVPGGPPGRVLVREYRTVSVKPRPPLPSEPGQQKP